MSSLKGVNALKAIEKAIVNIINDIKMSGTSLLQKI